MEKRHIKILKGISSEKRCRLFEYISEGIGHPDDLASKIKASRQAVDKQLEVLFHLGMIEKRAVTPPSGRPKVIFNITSQGQLLKKNLEKLTDDYISNLDREYHKEIEILDLELMKGNIHEDTYHKRSQDLKKMYKIIDESWL